MKKRQIALGVGIGGVILLCAISFWKTWVSYTTARQDRATREKTLRELEALFRLDPFPSVTNRLAVRREAAWLNSWYRTQVVELCAASIPAEKPTPGGFIQKLQTACAELRKKAAQDNRMVAEGFAFGFDRYIGAQKEMPQIEHCARLASQLEIIGVISCELFDSRISALTRVEREEFEGGAAPPPSPVGRRPVAAPTPSTAAGSRAAGRYPRQHFTFEFTSDQKALANVLSRLARLPAFVVVTELKVARRERGMLSLSSPAAAGSVLAGPEVAPLLVTTLQIDVYSFEGV